jgi:tRNA threonylcarbamoyladenosine biosynthesis protein TsaE
MQKFHSLSDSDTKAIAERIAKSLSPGTTVCLFGEMGVGKTVFTNGLCRALGVTDYVSSPTFTVVNEYDGADFPVYHFDMYRIEDEDELIEIGFEEYLSSGGVCIIEWPENIKNSLPSERVDIEILRGNDFSERTIIIKD